MAKPKSKLSMPMFSLDFGSRKSSVPGSRGSSDGDDNTLRGSLKREFGQPHYKSKVEAEGKLDFGELELELFDRRYMLRGYKSDKAKGWCRPSCIPISIILVLIILVVVLSLLDQKWEDERREDLFQKQQQWSECKKYCKLSVVESIPEGLIFNDTNQEHLSTYQAWLQLIELAQNEINIGSYYWTLQGKEFEHPSGAEGKDVFNRLMKTGLKKKVKIRIAQDLDSASYPNYDTQDLSAAGAAEIRKLNFSRLIGSGILHTKLWVVDRKHVYVGSANLDWRSLTQVKELGIFVTNCSCFAQDMQKIFDVYWELGHNSSKIPDKWPIPFQTEFGKTNPMNLAFNGTKYKTYISSSPPSFCPNGRTTDIDSILDVIDNATEYVHIAVMDYTPSSLYKKQPIYWPDIDDRLKTAAIDRRVKIRLLISKWNNTRQSQLVYLKSLNDLNRVYNFVDIQVKLFQVPSTPDQAKIPYARVNHNKYMVTDKSAYIGTSNWSSDYFISTGGVGVIITPRQNSNSTSDTSKEEGRNENDSNIRDQVMNIFERDWKSSYAKPLEQVLKDMSLD